MVKVYQSPKAQGTSQAISSGVTVRGLGLGPFVISTSALRSSTPAIINLWSERAGTRLQLGRVWELEWASGHRPWPICCSAAEASKKATSFFCFHGHLGGCRRLPLPAMGAYPIASAGQCRWQSSASKRAGESLPRCPSREQSSASPKRRANCGSQTCPYP